MADLPRESVTPSRPFLHSGVDYAGPLNIKAAKGRGCRSIKGYIAVFVCLSTKAIHLEPVGDMTTETFLGAFRRFISRRGICSDVYSDRGTTFVGASSEINRLKENAEKSWNQTVGTALADIGIRWHFIPPYSPHFGGLWEAAVKSFKHHFRRVIGETLLTYEELATCLAEIEACLNSRPLSPMSSDPDDLLPLTPGHFLIGDALTSLPEPNRLSESPKYLSRWKLIQQIQQHFWLRWSREYLSILQQRNKWSTLQPNLNVNDMVLIKEDSLSPTKWRIARVQAVHPGTDKRVRVVTLRCRDGIITRPITRICKLPLSVSDSDHKS